jgi:hypothetical protein
VCPCPRTARRSSVVATSSIAAGVTTGVAIVLAVVAGVVGACAAAPELTAVSGFGRRVLAVLLSVEHGLVHWIERAQRVQRIEQIVREIRSTVPGRPTRSRHSRNSRRPRSTLRRLGTIRARLRSRPGRWRKPARAEAHRLARAGLLQEPEKAHEEDDDDQHHYTKNDVSRVQVDLLLENVRLGMYHKSSF